MPQLVGYMSWSGRHGASLATNTVILYDYHYDRRERTGRRNSPQTRIGKPPMPRLTATVRIWLLGLLTVAVWVASASLNEPHRIAGLAASPSQFAAERSELILARLLGAERPHPVSSEENAAVRARLLQEFARLGIPASTYQAFSCEMRRTFAIIACATVNDVIAEVLPGQGRAVLMMAHYDSVASGPGASDNMSGVAVVLEAARALRASTPNPLHPVMALITDGEEAGLLGAYAFLQNAPFRERIGAVVNVDARGTRGPSLLFQTSAGSGQLIDLYARSVAAPDTSSLYAEIYRRLPNDTDLTPFLQAGFPSFNFAFIGQVHSYHSPRDLRRNLSAATLQMHGDNLLGVTRSLAQTPYASLKGADQVYLSVLNRVLLRLPAGSALPLAIAVWLAMAAASRRAGIRLRGALLRELLIFPGLIVACLAAGFLLEFVARLIARMPDPSYAYPLALRLSLALGVWAAVLTLSRRSDVLHSTASTWLWMATLAVMSAALVRGLAPYFLFPLLVATPLLFATAFSAGGWLGPGGLVARALGALAALIVWTGLMVDGEAVMGIRLHPLFTVPAAFGLATLVPLMEMRMLAHRAWSISAGLSAGAALVVAVIAGLLPTYSEQDPQRLNLLYVQDRSDAHWVVPPSPYDRGLAPLPAALARAAPFRLEPLNDPIVGAGRAYIADAGEARLTMPTAQLLSVAPTGMQSGIVALHGSEQANAMVLFIPGSLRLRTIELGGQQLTAPPGWDQDTYLVCLSRDCRDERVSLRWTGSARDLEFAEQRYGLPSFGIFLEQARPKSAVPSQAGDEVMLISELPLEARSASSGAH
jgi:hypothetical protein